MYKGLIIRSSDFKFQPLDTKTEKETEKYTDHTDIHSKDYETIRKLVKETDKMIQKFN